MDATLGAILLIAERYHLEPGDWFTVTLNAAGNPSIEYGRKLTREGVDSGKYTRETPWRKWEGPKEQER